MIFLIQSIFFLFNVYAADTCDYIPEYTCSDTVLNDGTGTMTLNKNWERSLKINEESMVQITKDFQKALLSTKKPASKFDIEVALSATGMKLAPACSKKRKNENDSRITFACARTLAKTLARRGRSEIFGARFRSEKNSLEDEVLLRNSVFFKEIVNKQKERLKKSSESKELDKKIEEMFVTSVGFVNKIIDKKIANSKTKALLKAKINTIRFNGTDCSDSETNFDINEVYSINAYYDSTNNTFRFCKGLADSGLSEYNLIRVITHELAHSIDPCRFQFAPKSLKQNYKTDNPYEEYPFQVLQCLRSEGSIQAFDPENSDGYTQGDSDASNSAQETSEDKKQPFCHKLDQINESFCDWLGAEAVYQHMKTNLSKSTKQQYIDGVASISKVVCLDNVGLGKSNLGKTNYYSPHPADRDRLTHIFLAHPGIRRLLGCSSLKEDGDVKYCSFTKGQTEVFENSEKNLQQKNGESIE
jgi:hypothetical protein